MSSKSSKKNTETGGKARDDATRYKKLRKTLAFLFNRDGLKERDIPHETDDEVAVDDILASEHFSNLFTAEDFDHAVAKDSHDSILKEEPHFLLVTSNGRKVIKYYKEALEYKEEGANAVQPSDGADVGHSKESAAVINEEESDKHEEKAQKNESATSGSKKAKNKKNKASTGGSEGGDNKSQSKKEDKESPVPNVPVVKEPILSAESETKAEIVSGNNDKHQNDPKDSNPKSHPSSETLVESKGAKSASENNDEVLKDEIDSGEGFSTTVNKKGSKKSPKQKGKQSDASGGTKNSGNESKQNKDGKQAAGSPGKTGKQTEKSPGSQTKEQKASESKQKNSDKPTKSEKLQKKLTEDVNSAALSSDEEKVSGSLEGPPKKKLKPEDRLKKIQAAFKYLFGDKGGLKEKQIAVGEGGFVKVKSIIDAYQVLYQWTENEISDALSNNEDYIFDHDDAHGLLMKAAEKKSQPVDQPVEVEEPGNDDSWQASGKRREGPDDRRQRPPQNSAGNRPPGVGSTPPEKLRSTLYWILSSKDGADKHSIQVLPGKRLYVDEIISKVPNLNHVSVSEIKTAAESESRKQFLFEETNGRTTVQLQESRAPRDRNFQGGKGDLYLSKSMSFILRHGAEKLQIPIQPDGFMYVDDLLTHKDLRSYQVEDVRRVVQDNDKQRFLIAEDPVTRRLKVRANQGHTFVVPDLELQPITTATDAPTVVHGTYHDSWKIIQKQGLSRMSRNHIHCAVGEPGSDGVISGMRGSCDVLVFIDMQAALSDGIKFFRSANNVILSPGNDQGVILPKYFKTAVQRNPRMKLM